jgi:putative transcriptional regulator
MMMRVVLSVLLLGVAVHAEDLAAGKFLVAHRDLGDPNFAQTVVLLLHYDEDEGAMGLIINRQTKLPISRALKLLKDTQTRSDPVYLGGPVDRTTIQALLRSPIKLEEADHIFSDVYTISSERLLEKSLRAGTDASAFRVYLGYAGWGADQLEREVEAGGWWVFPGDAKNVFDAHPETLWRRLIEKTELQIARDSFFTQERSSAPPHIIRIDFRTRDWLLPSGR